MRAVKSLFVIYEKFIGMTCAGAKSNSHHDHAQVVNGLLVVLYNSLDYLLIAANDVAYVLDARDPRSNLYNVDSHVDALCFSGL